MRGSREYFRDFVENALDIIVIVDENGDLRYINSSVERILGYRPKDMIGKSAFKFIHRHDLPNVMEHFTHALQNPVYTPALDLRVRSKDGSWHYLEAIGKNSLNNPVVAGIVVSARDITERKKTEERLEKAYQRLKETQEQLIQSAKMAAVGHLAAGISHELKQPLTGIKGFAQAALMNLDKKNPVRNDLRRIIEGSDRMDNIIKNLLLFARKSDFKTEELQVNKPIKDSLMLLGRQLKLHNIRLKKSLAKNLPKIKGDPNQLQQVFLNIVANAIDAIDSLRRPEGGELTIKSVLSEDKKNIEITFADTGCGISKENLSHLFNPFFTTKSPDRGTGLGLAVAYRIIENHNGKIEVESQEGKGTTFKISLLIV